MTIHSAIKCFLGSPLVYLTDGFVLGWIAHWLIGNKTLSTEVSERESKEKQS